MSAGWLVGGLLMIPTWPSFFTLVASICCFVKYGKQVSERNLHRRFQRYCAAIGMRGRASLKQLKKVNGTGIAQVREDMQKMIVRGYFGPGAYIDFDRDELVLPDVAGAEQKRDEKWGNAWDQCDRDYDSHGLDAFMEMLDKLRKGNLFQGEVRAEDYAYRPSSENFERQGAAAKPKPAPKREENQPKSEQVEPEPPKRTAKPQKRTYAEELERTLNELYQLNAKIEDEGVYHRIDRIGTLTAGIFRVVIEKPEREQDVRKFMNYYLPTTLKLLRSYDLMEEQEYQSESIQESRRKIEEVLDALIQAYEKQLDRLFRDDALDIATDIDVLETMMAGDGLM